MPGRSKKDNTCFETNPEINYYIIVNSVQGAVQVK